MEGLAWIERLDQELQANSKIRFSAFLAHRALCFSRFFAASENSLADKTDAELPTWFGSEEVASGRRALDVIARIEKDDPDYLPSLDFTEGMIDQVAQIVERLEPGAARQALGWTKLIYLGFGRLKMAPTYSPIDGGNLNEAIRTRLINLPPFRSALTLSDDPTSTVFYILRGDFNLTATVGDADPVGRLTVASDGEVNLELESDPVDDTGENDRSGLSHPNREHLLSECNLLLRYETNAEKRKYMKDMIAWLEGKGARPTPVPTDTGSPDKVKNPSANTGCAIPIVFLGSGISASIYTLAHLFA